METKYKAFNSKRKFGVEFELSNNVEGSQLQKILVKASPDRCVHVDNGWAQTNNGNDYWHIKRDSTCGPEGKTKELSLYGWEIASYVGKGISDILHMGKVVSSLKKEGAVINKHCGIHIHADASNLSVEQVGTIMAYWVKIERTMFQSCPSHRRRNKYCKSLRRKVPVSSKLNPTQFWEKIRPQNLYVHENNDKKVSINSVGYTATQAGNHGYKSTLELRMPEASLDKRDVINWIRLYLNFIETTKKAEMPLSRRVAGVKDTLQILGLEGVQNFLILSAGMYETKLWFLNRIVEHSCQANLVKEAKGILKDISTL